MAKRMVTTTEARAILKERGIDAPYQTLVRWVRSGRFKGAQLDESNPRGAVWLIPLESLARFELPPIGRPSKASKKSSKK